jgi:hypothetical protein
MDAMATAATGGKWGPIRVLSQWLRKAGIRNVDAERLARQAIDPAQLDQAIEYLASRGLPRATAVSVLRQLGSVLRTVPAGRIAGAAVATEEAPPPPNSVRALVR